MQFIEINKILTMHFVQAELTSLMRFRIFDKIAKGKGMLLKRTNVAERLKKLRAKEVSDETILADVYEFLRQETEKDKRVLSELSGGKGVASNAFSFELLETDRIFHLNQIKQICIDYRLRFLDSRYFKAQIPQEAVFQIKQLEKHHEIQLEGFKIVAPSRLFKLEDKNDPLLFAPIGNGYYYLIHKWGNDLHPLRKLMVWPFRNIVNLTLLVALLSYFVTLLVPEGLFSKTNSSAEFWIIFFFMFKSIAAIVIFYAFALGKNFNQAIWRSKYFNA